MVVFCGEPGRIVALQDPCAPGAARLVTAEGFDSGSFHSIITSVGVSSAGNFQLMHTLGSGIYLYVFGDRVGGIRLQGMSFAGSCGASGTVGIERIMQYYQANRIAARKTPMSITIGTRTTLTGYLAGISTNIEGNEQRISQFELNFIQIPR